MIRRHVVGIDAKVPIIGGHNDVPYINFDNAASTPVLEPVMDKLRHWLPWYSSVHRGAGIKSRMSTEAYDSAHHIIRQFVGADQDYTVIFGKNTTDALNKLARRLPLTPDDVVIISSFEHHSNDLPWRTRATVHRVNLTPTGGFDMLHFKQLLRRCAGRVKLVAVSGASNVTGYIAPIYDIARLAHAAGAEIAVDAAQLAPHRTIFMRSLNDPAHLDYVAFSAHKMYAPFGIGALVGRADTFAVGAPDYSGGGTVKYVSKHIVDWADGWERDEAGSPNVLGAVAFAAAVQTLERIGMGRIVEHEAMLTNYALRMLADIPGVIVYGDADPTHANQRTGVISFTVEGIPHGLVAAMLSYQYGIGTRNGCFCAHPYVLDLLGVGAAERSQVRQKVLTNNRADVPGMVRISFGIYNTVEELNALGRALHAIITADKRDYVFDPIKGEYKPKNMAKLGPSLSGR